MIKVTIEEDEDVVNFKDLAPGDVFKYADLKSAGCKIRTTDGFVSLLSGSAYTSADLAVQDLVYLGKIKEIKVKR